MGLYILFCLIGFLLLYFGAEWLVKGSSSLARSLGITPMVIGLTVVAFGTSTPELVVSLVSSIKGNSMIAVGNVVGSNICNIALILGLAALFQPITAQRSVVRRDIPMMLGISLYLLVLSLNSRLGRLEGLTLVLGIFFYTFYNYRVSQKAGQASKKSAAAAGIDDIPHISSRPKQLILIAAGIGGVVGGAELVVNSAVQLMTILGVGEKFIGLTIVAFGTSLPELATSVVAAIRKEMDISLGNLVGSNVFNLLGVLGTSALIAPIPIPGGFYESGLWVDYLAMLFTSALPWFFMKKTNTITRSGGAILLFCYVVYLTYLILKTI